MNKKGSLFLGLTFAFFFFMFGMLMVPLMEDAVTSARTNINCSNSSALTSGTKLVCLGLDTGVPYYIIAILTLIGGFIGNELK